MGRAEHRAAVLVLLRHQAMGLAPMVSGPLAPPRLPWYRRVWAYLRWLLEDV